MRYWVLQRGRPYVSPSLYALSLCVRVRVRRLGLVKVRVRDTERWGQIQKPSRVTQRPVSTGDIEKLGISMGGVK